MFYIMLKRLLFPISDVEFQDEFSEKEAGVYSYNLPE